MTMLLALTALATAQPDSFTLSEARALAPAALAERVMGPLGRLYPESLINPDQAGTALEEVQFASPPRVRADGVCGAERVSVRFQPAGADGASRIDGVDTIHTYRLVGEALSFATGSAARNDAVMALCRTAGPVLDHGGPSYFISDQNEGDISMIARALTLVRAAARRGPIPALTCADNPNVRREHFCADPSRLVAGLDLGWITDADIAPCGTDTRRLCAVLTFAQPQTDPSRVRDVVLTIQIDGTLGNPVPERIGIHAVSLELRTEQDS